MTSRLSNPSYLSLQVSSGNYKIQSEVFDLNNRYLNDSEQLFLENGFLTNALFAIWSYAHFMKTTFPLYLYYN